MKKSVFLLLLVSASVFSQVKTRSYIIDPQLAPRDHNVDFRHMRVELAFEPQKGLVKGRCTHVFSPLRPKVDSVWVDGIKMTVKGITVNGKTAKYRTDSAGIMIYFSPALAWETTDSMTITYECTPRKGLYFIGWNDPQNLSRKQIWSQGQGIDNRHWIPMYDEMNDKFISEMIVTFDKTYKVLSNGTRLAEKENKDGTKTWRYEMKHPHAPYLVMLGIGKYEIDERKSKSGVPLHLYYYPDWKDRVAATYQRSEDMIDFFEKEYGIKYPWESYSQIPVQDFMYGAMENTTATVFGDFIFVDDRSFNDRGYVGVNAHELTHQWFGDYVTAESDAHHWLQESFATYGNMMFEREFYGKDYFDWERHNAQNESVEESKKNKCPVAHSEAGSTRHYPKGATVLNMLKYVVGDREVYNKCIKYYLEHHPYSNVDTEDLLEAFEEVTGMQLDWFFEEWIYKGGEPDYLVKYEELNGNTVFTVTQKQELSDITGLPVQGGNAANAVSTDPFVGNMGDNGYRAAGLWKMPVWFEVHYTDGTSDKKMQWIEKQTETVKVPSPPGKKIDFVLFDPDNEVMKSVTFEKPLEMLKAQAAKAEHMLDRFDAIYAMRNTDTSAKRDFLVQQFDKEKTYVIQSEIVTQLIHDTDPKSQGLIRKAIAGNNPQVQKTVINNTKQIAPQLMSDYEKLLSANSYEVVANALDRLCSSNPAQTNRYLDATRNIEGTVGRNVKMKWLEIAARSEKKYIDQLVGYTSLSYEFRTRVNAINSLKALNYLDEVFIKNMVDASMSANGRLAGPAIETLKFFSQQVKYREMIQAYIGSRTWQPWQREIIKRYE